MAATTTSASQTFCRSASIWCAGALAPGKLWWNVWNRRQYSYTGSNGNLQPQGNANRHTGDCNAIDRDNGDAQSSADAGEDANPAPDAIALRYSRRRAACFGGGNRYREYRRAAHRPDLRCRWTLGANRAHPGHPGPAPCPRDLLYYG